MDDQGHTSNPNNTPNKGKHNPNSGHAPNKDKESVTVRELEHYAKHYRLQVFFCLLFIVAGIFGLLWSRGWSIAFACLGGIVGVIFAEPLSRIARRVSGFFFHQDRTVQIIIAAMVLILGIFVAPLIFLFLGMHGGKSIYRTAKEAQHFPQ